MDGLAYFQDVITPEEAEALQQWIYRQPWQSGPGNRVVQQYGFIYDYKARSVSPTTPMPPQLIDLGRRLVEVKQLSVLPNQAIINHYEPGQGITPHTDHKSFGEEISSLTLGSATTMVLAHGNETREVRLEPRSLLVMSGPARRLWTHCIPSRRSDVVNGVTLPRGTRDSITFRTVPT